MILFSASLIYFETASSIKQRQIDVCVSNYQFMKKGSYLCR